MPMPGIVQPEVLPVDGELRLRAYDGEHGFALGWYQDEELVYLVDGVREPYTLEKLGHMYRWLDERGELYFIEAMQDGQWRPIGDVTLMPDDLPIVIGEAEYRGKGVGGHVLRALIARGREIGLARLSVQMIYHYNAASLRCFEKAGFVVIGRTEKGVSCVLDLG